jgi:hypothetical protein
MKKQILSCLLGLLAFTACGDNDDPEPDPEPAEPTVIDITAGKTAQRTVLVYIAAENSLSSFAKTDIDEMLEGIQDVDVSSNSLLVYVDDTRAPRLQRITRMTDGTAVAVDLKDYDEQDSSRPSVMKQVIEDAFGLYPAKSYGLVLWSHGEGWIPGTGYSSKTVSQRWWSVDNNSNSTSNTGTKMEIADLAATLSATVHFDFILFDSCFMSSAEVCYELKDCASYLIGSPAEIPGPGSPYDLITPYFFSQSSDCATQIAKAYYDDYAAIYDPSATISNSHWTGGVCISVVKTAQMEALASATAKVLPQYINAEEGPVYSEVQSYDARSNYRYYHDLKDFMRQQTGSDTSVYDEWLRSFNAAVVYWASTPTVFTEFSSSALTIGDNAGGLSLFIPRLVKQDLLPYFHKTKWYTAAGWDQTGW